MVGKDVVMVYKGIEITVSEEQGSFTTYFRNAPGEYNIPPQGVKRLENQPSYEAALNAGKEFVDNHQWEFVKKFDIFEIFIHCCEIFIRCWWDGDWGYSIRCSGAINKAGFSSKEMAIKAARVEAKNHWMK